MAKLKVGDRVLSKMLNKNAGRLDKMRAVLEDLQKTTAMAAPPPELPATDSQNQQTSDRRP